MLLRKLALALAATALTLLGVEAVVRALDLRITSLHRGLLKLSEMEVFDEQRNLLTVSPDTDAVLFGYETHINSLGVRDREPVMPKPPGRFRILLLGDSMVFGQGVAQREMVGEVLRREIGSDDVDVVSAGVPGWNTLSEEQFLAKHQAAIDPDVVVLLYVENDNEPFDPFERARHAPRGLSEKVYRTLLLHSRAFEWAAYVYRSRIAGSDPGVAAQARQWSDLVASQGPPFSPDDRGWIASRDAMLRMSQSLQRRGARMVVFLFDLGTVARDAPVRVRLGEFARQSGVPLFETRPFFAGHAPGELMIAPIVDPHPNALGHELLGKGIARTLRQQRLLPH